MKKRGFGAGKWNGYGGKLQAGEDAKIGAVRELHEESNLVVSPDDLRQVAIINFFFDGKPEFECFVYIAHAWQGEPMETEEMRPQWYPITQLPFGQMWAADVQWIPLVLSGQKILADVNFSADGSEVKEFNYTPAEY